MADIMVSPTRMELLNLKEKKKLALKGHKLLKSKQDALIMNFFEKLKELKTKRRELGTELEQAYRSLLIAQALDGASNIKSSAFNYPETFQLEHGICNIMGVKIMTTKALLIDTNIDLFLGGSNQLMDAYNKFRSAVVKVIKVAELENTVRLLGEEIKKTKRRINSLEHIKIPALCKSLDYVSMMLAEMERENFFRLKIIKERLEEIDES